MENTVSEKLERNMRKTKTGIVVSDKMQKTIVVEVNNHVMHPVYKKVVEQISKFKAHDEKNEAHIGDTVEIEETRPLSRDKCWRLLRIIEKAK